MKHAREDYNRIQDPDGKIPDQEPVFLIRGQDIAAVETLRFYAMEAHRMGADIALISKVLMHADEMMNWQNRVARKTPDLKP